MRNFVNSRGSPAPTLGIGVSRASRLRAILFGMRAILFFVAASVVAGCADTGDGARTTAPVTNGVYRGYWGDGSLKEEGRLSNGVKVGEWRSFRTSGELWIVGTWSNGAKHGRWTEFNVEGKSINRDTYTNGLPIRMRDD